MTSIINEMTPKLRRAIGDTKEPYMYSDNALTEYLEDAIDKVGIDWKHGYIVDRVNHEISEDINGSDQMLFVAQATYDLRNLVPDMSYRTGTMSVTRKSTGKTRLWNELKQLIDSKKFAESTGVSSSEFDTYEDRFKNILYE